MKQRLINRKVTVLIRDREYYTNVVATAILTLRDIYATLFLHVKQFLLKGASQYGQRKTSRR